MVNVKHLRRVLVIRTDRLGDMVVTLPVIQELARQLPDAAIDVLCRPYVAPLLERHPAVKGILTADYAETGWRKSVREIRAGRYDAAVVVHPTLRDTFVVWAARVPLRVGSGFRWYSFMYNRPVFYRRSLAERHEIESNLLNLNGLGLKPPNPTPTPYVPVLESDISSAKELLGETADARYIILHPGSGGSSVNWPAKYYAELARRLAEETGKAIVTTGARTETADAEEVARAAGGVSVAGRTDFGALLGVIAGAAVFICGSTGPMHLAAALGRPVVALFAPYRRGCPARWRPVGAPSRVLMPTGYSCDNCAQKKCPDYNCMDGLAVDDILAASLDLLSETRGKEGAKPDVR